MIYELNTEKSRAAIQYVISKQDDILLQKLYQYCGNNKLLEQGEVLKLWYGFEDIGSLQPIVLSEVLKFCIDHAGYDLGRYEDYLVEGNIEKIRSEYLETIKNTKTKYATVQWLNALDEVITNTTGVDLPQVSIDEAIDGMTKLPDVSVSSLRQALSIARSYCEWCLKNNKYDIKTNPFKKISIDDIPLETWVERNVIRDVYSLSSMIKRQYPLDEGYLAPIAMCFAWMGFTDKEILQIKNEDVDKINGTVLGKPIPQPLRDIIFIYSNVDVVYRKNGFGVVRYEAQDIGLYIKRLSVKENKGKLQLSDLRNAMTQVSWTSLNRIRISSVLNRLYQHEQKSGHLFEEDYAHAFNLNREATSFLARLKEKRLIYEAYKNVYYSHA